MEDETYIQDGHEDDIREENLRQRLIGLAYNQVMEMLEKKKCPPSILKELIKQGGPTGRLEEERLQTANELNRRKAESIRQVSASKDVAEKAIEAMQTYYGK